MNEDDNILREYLLGILHEKEAEQLDELSVTDAEVSGRLTAAENDLIDSYAAGELSGSELQYFESHYLASSMRRQKVVFARAFQEFGKSSLTPREVTETERAPSIIAGLSAVFRWGFAIAMLLLVVTAGWFWLGRTKPQDVAVTTPPADQTDLRSPLPTPVPEQQPQPGKDEIATVPENSEPRNVNAPQTNRKTEEQGNSQVKPKTSVAPTIATFILAPPTRGQVQSITIPSGTTRAMFTLELESSDFAKYRLTLRQQSSGRVVWQSGSFRGGQRSTVNASVPANLLQPQIYTFSVTGITRDGISEIIGDYAFRVVQ